MATRIAAVVVLAALLSGSQAAVQVLRAPGSVQPDVLRTLEHPECTSIYRVTLEAKYSTQGNDLGMLPTHGRDTRIPSDDARYNHFNDQAGFATKTLKIGADYRDEPAANDAAKQANARSKFSVTALTEPDATPMGFQRSNINMHYAVCVSVTNTYSRWLEIMAETLQPDQQICVSDWNRPDLADNPYQTACGNGNLYTCRESPLETAGADGLDNLNEEVGFKFYCSENCDDPQYDIFWRITASQLTASRVTTDGGRTLWMQPDAENWCGMRDGDDFPSSLLDPYPDRYDNPAVFSLRSSASVTVTSVVTLAALAVVRALF